MIFHDYTLAANGAIVSHRTHESGNLAPAAVAIFAGMLTAGRQWDKPIAPLGHISLHWTRLEASAVGTFSARGIPTTTSFLFTGGHVEEEQDLLEAIDQFLVGLGGSPAGLTITQRPLIISIPLIMNVDLEIIADMETCLAAAFFEVTGKTE